MTVTKDLQDVLASQTAQENWAAAGCKLPKNQISEANYFMAVLRCMPDVRLAKVGQARQRIKSDPSYDLVADDAKMKKVLAAIMPDLLA